MGPLTASTEYLSSPTNSGDTVVTNLHLLRRPPLPCNTTSSSAFDTEHHQTMSSPTKNPSISNAERMEDCLDAHSETTECCSDYSTVAAVAHNHQPAVTIPGQPSNMYMNPAYGSRGFVKRLPFTSKSNLH